MALIHTWPQLPQLFHVPTHHLIHIVSSPETLVDFLPPAWNNKAKLINTINSRYSLNVIF